MFFPSRYRTPLSITFPEVATHNHFVLDRGGKVFKQTAPVIKLRNDASEDEHLALLGLLNSSIACFWLKQVCFPKGGDHQGTEGARVRRTQWDERYAFNASNIGDLPVVQSDSLEPTRAIDQLGATLSAIPLRAVRGELGLRDARFRFEQGLHRMIALQEELDWECYALYGLIDSREGLLASEPPLVRKGERAFEVVMARKMAAGELLTAWFERHGSTPITEIPAHWPEPYKQVVERRIELIESNPEIGLIEQPEYKRRWNVEPWDAQVERSLREWLLDSLESESYWCDIGLTSVARLADRARQNAEFMSVAILYRGQDHFDASALVAELVESASVPFLPVLRYKASGMRKRELWERVWDLQRREDAKEDVGNIPVPPKYTSADFANGVFWQLRGKLDVPKERFISYPYCRRDADPTQVIAWAGWDHLQQAKALATYYVQMKESEGWSKERLMPLLAGLLELVPWLVQWHNEIDPEYGQRMGEFYDGFVDEEARALGLTREAIRAWAPPTAAARRRGRRAP
jgi:hypothetical protein